MAARKNYIGDPHLWIPTGVVASSGIEQFDVVAAICEHDLSGREHQELTKIGAVVESAWRARNSVEAASVPRKKNGPSVEKAGTGHQQHGPIPFQCGRTVGNVEIVGKIWSLSPRIAVHIVNADATGSIAVRAGQQYRVIGHQLGGP